MSRAFIFIGLFALLVFAIYEHNITYTTDDSLIAYANAEITKQNKETPPNAFTQDGCSLFPDTLLWHDFRPACLDHDIAYWAGGSDLDKVSADLDFKDAVSETGPIGTLIAPFMYIGVSVFGDSWLTKLVGANWGYGYNE